MYTPLSQFMPSALPDTQQLPPGADAPFDDRLLDGIAVYQDVVLDGRTVRRGARDCEGRWRQIAPRLDGCRSLLDIGANFGWFGRRACGDWPGCVVASVEADERSAAVQRRVLESHADRRMCLLTRRAGARLIERFRTAGTRFDAALCLNVLHWIPDHREFMAALGQVAGRIVVEYPHPDEAGSGVEAIRRQIGPIGPYLTAALPGRTVERLALVPSHRDSDLLREVWIVEQPDDGPARPDHGIDAAALLDLSPAWPPRSWWREQLDAMPAGKSPSDGAGGVRFTASGLRASAGDVKEQAAALHRRLNRVPEDSLFTPRDRLIRRTRRLAGIVARGIGLRRM